MLKNYLIVAIRNLLRNKTYASINIFGLVLGIVICLPIITFIKGEKSSDRFHVNSDRIVRLYTTDNNIEYSEIKGYATSPGSLGPYLINNYPIIDDVVRVRQVRGSVIHQGTAVSVGGMYAEASFFDIFSYSLSRGDANTALNEPYSIIISEATALKLFGDEDPVGQIMTFENLGDFTVTGILKDSNEKSHFRFEALFSFASLRSLEENGILDSDMTSWNSYDQYYTYVLLVNSGDASLLRAQLPEIERAIFPEPENERFGFEVQRLRSINLGTTLWLSMPGTKKSFDIIFIPVLGVLIVFLACFNYIILSIASTLKRTREIGIRDAIGAKRSQTIAMFMVETILVVTIALVVAYLFDSLFLPAFNRLEVIANNDLQINHQLLTDPGLILVFILFGIGVSVAAGIIPAFYLSSFQPVNALKGISYLQGLSGFALRKVLMGVQFAVSLIAIIFIIHSNQLNTFLKRFDYGIETSDLVNVYLRDVDYEVFRNEMLAQNNVRSISFSNQVPVFGGLILIEIENEAVEEPQLTYCFSVDPEFIRNFNLEVLSGRNFSNSIESDKQTAIIVNQEALRHFALGSPSESIGKTLTINDSVNVQVIGVIRDFNYTYPDMPIEPMVLMYQPEEFAYANIKYEEGSRAEIDLLLENVWEEFDPIHPVIYEHFEDAQRETDRTIDNVLGVFKWISGFIILIALLGLLGMAKYTAAIKTREIGIRKVVGAGVVNVVHVLSKDYIKLILYYSIGALPIAYFLSRMFYQFFAFRPDLSLWVLPAALAFILSAAILTIISQTARAALANPVDSLREN